MAKDGYDQSFGARAMRRLVNLELGDIISSALLQKKINEGDKVQLIPGKDKGEFTIEKMVG